jgi:hypothetical protein
MVENRDTVGFQRLGDGGSGTVRACRGMARATGEQGEGGHHDTSDTDEKDGAFFLGTGLQVCVDALCAFVGIGCRHGNLLWHKIVLDGLGQKAEKGRIPSETGGKGRKSGKIEKNLVKWCYL